MSKKRGKQMYGKVDEIIITENGWNFQHYILNFIHVKANIVVVFIFLIEFNIGNNWSVYIKGRVGI